MSLDHWPGCRTALSWPETFGFAPNSGRKPRGMWSLWSGSDSVLSVPAKVMSEMIWCGFIVPCRVSRRWIVMSVIEPGPWWPMMGMPLMAAMSTAVPVECSLTLPDDAR